MKRIAIVLAIALLTNVACSKTEDPTSVKLEDIIQLEITGPTTVRADGVSTTSLQAKIPAEATTRNVKFATTRGTFQGTDAKNEITVIADDNGIATATMIAGREVGSATVSATAGTFVASRQLPHERAFADAIAVETSSATPKKDGTRNAVITAILTRNNGFVSPGAQVTFEAFAVVDGVRRSVGRFAAVATSDATGRATATFSPDTPDTAVGMNVTVVVTTQNDAGATLSAEISLQVA
jgi:hypothetical protein